MLRLFLFCVLLLLSACERIAHYEPELNLNVNASRNFSSPLLFSYNSCEELNAGLKKTALDEMHARFAIKAKEGPQQFVKENGPMPGGIAVDTVSAPSAPTAPVEGVDFSGTNNQEKGIDEADIIKTDGKFFYALNKSTLSIVEMPQIGELKEASVLRLESPGSGILLNDERAFVIADESGFKRNAVRLDTIDLGADRKQPRVSETNYFEGDLVAARKIGSKIYLATYLDNHIPGLVNYPIVGNDFYQRSEPEQNELWIEAINRAVQKNEEIINNYDFLSLVPKQLNHSDSQLESQAIGAKDCNRTFGVQDGSANGFLSLITLDDKGLVDIQRVRGKRPVVYASEKQFILASPEHEPWWFFNNEELKDQTTIHRFDLDQSGTPTYHDSLRVPGTLHNSFSLSEHDNYLRVATTTRPQSRFWMRDRGSLENRDENHLFVLGDNNGKLDVVGSIEGLAPGEKIWSARFSDDLGFLVTFKKVDPLFTLDLKDPTQPKVAGELKIPGVSTYLQEIDQNHLLAVGYGGDEKGTDFQTTVSLFDVSDLKNPKLADSLQFSLEEGLNHSWSRVSSEANQTHLAVNYFSPVAMTAIPLETNRYIQNPLDPSGGQFEYVSKLTLVDTKVGEELKIHGEVDHSKYYNKDPSDYLHSSSIRRSYFVGDYIYAISSKAITANKLSDMSTTGEYEFR